jgi:hypothetical protein
MILVSKNISVPDYFRHDPTLKNNHGDTVAMIMVKCKKTLTKEWYHDPIITNKKG